VRVVVALGGNALLRRGEPLTAENQRANARVACGALATLEHQLVISHGNGPQVGLLALQGSAYTAVEPYPLDLLDAQTEGMIGYLIQQKLGNPIYAKEDAERLAGEKGWTLRPDGDSFRVVPSPLPRRSSASTRSSGCSTATVS